MKSNNFVVIQGWMCNELGLKGNELLVFALIYGFSQDEVSKFHGTRQYIADTFNISRPTVDKALQGLLDKQYICKEGFDDFVNPNVYWTNFDVVKKLYMGCKETLQGGCKETLLNNIDTNQTNKKEVVSKDTTTEFTFGNQKPKKENLYSKCVALINEFTDDAILQSYLTEFLQRCLANSKESGTPFYTNTFRGKLNKLKTLSDDNYIQRDIVMQTLNNGWNGFYELKQDKLYNKDNNRFGEAGIVRTIPADEEYLKQVEEFAEKNKREGKQYKF